jgi:TolA-binding protein
MSHPSENEKRESIEEVQKRIEETKRKLRENEALLEREERELGRLVAEGEHQQREFHYFVDEVKYTTKSSTLTGAEVKANIKDFNPAYSLFLEGGGKNADKLFTDTDAISLLDCDEPHFITVPPATFGK